MAAPHGPHNQAPTWRHRPDSPMLPGFSNAPSSGQMLNPSYPTRTHCPAPPTRSCFSPPVSTQQHLQPGIRANTHSHGPQFGVGSSSSGHYAPLPRSQNPPQAPSPPDFNFAFKQKVRARITANGWVIGIIVSALQLCSKITGLGYVVEIETSGGAGRYERREFTVDDLKPYWPPG